MVSSKHKPVLIVSADVKTSPCGSILFVNVKQRKPRLDFTLHLSRSDERTESFPVNMSVRLAIFILFSKSLMVPHSAMLFCGILIRIQMLSE